MILRTSCAALAMLLLAGIAQAQSVPEAPVRYDEDLLTPAFHQERRARLMDALPDDGVAVFFSSPERVRERSVYYRYRQDSDLYYLTGTHEAESVLLLVPAGVEVDGRTVREILFVPPRSPQREMWDGRLFGPERAREVLGVELAVSNDRFAEIAEPLLAGRRLFHLPPPTGVVRGSRLDAQVGVVGPHVEAGDGRMLRTLLTEMRMVKADEEIVLLERAIDITAEAHREVMRAIRPGMFEYEVEALVEYVFRRSGAAYAGFPGIVASGENSVILHYNTNRRRMQDGDVVVIDIGAEYHGYSADVTRTLPVNGRFSPEQRAIYEIVLAAQEAGIAEARPGARFQAPGQAAFRVVADGLRALGLAETDGDVRRFFPHSTSHYLGLNVHDVGTGGVLVPGVVITVEPGIYIPAADDIDPRWWHIGVRIEDDILITDDGPVNLSASAPRTVEEIEALMGGRR